MVQIQFQPNGYTLEQKRFNWFDFFCLTRTQPETKQLFAHLVVVAYREPYCWSKIVLFIALMENWLFDVKDK